LTDARLSGALAIAGALVAIIANIIWPRAADPGDAAAYLRGIAASPFWHSLHLMVIGSLLIGTGAFVLLERALRDTKGGRWAQLGQVAVGAAATLGVAVFSIGGYALHAAASAWVMASPEQAAAAFHAASVLLSIDTALFSIWIVLWFGIGFGMFGCALAVSGRVAPVVGWGIVPVSLAAIGLGVVQYHQGYSRLLTDQLFAAVAGSAMLWLLTWGAALLRRGD
jgi:hypothetical protein